VKQKGFHFIYGGTECIFSKFAHDIRLSGAVDSFEARKGIQRELEELAHLNCTEFDKAKYKVLHLDQGNPPSVQTGR